MDNDELKKLEEEERALLAEINKVDQVVVKMKDEYEKNKNRPAIQNLHQQISVRIPKFS